MVEKKVKENIIPKVERKQPTQKVCLPTCSMGHKSGWTITCTHNIMNTTKYSTFRLQI